MTTGKRRVGRKVRRRQVILRVDLFRRGVCVSATKMRRIGYRFSRDGLEERMYPINYVRIVDYAPRPQTATVSFVDAPDPDKDRAFCEAMVDAFARQATVYMINPNNPLALTWRKGATA